MTRSALFLAVFALAMMGCVTDPESPQTGTIIVTSDPDSIKVHLDLESTGKVTPCTLTSIPVGTHRIGAQSPGLYHNEEQSVDVRNNEISSAHFVMRKYVRRLYVTTHPPGAAIIVKGKNNGVTPDTIEVLYYSDASFRLTLPGHYPIGVHHRFDSEAEFEQVDTTFTPITKPFSILFAVRDTLKEVGLDGVNPRILRIMPNVITGLLWSPDGTHLACRTRDSNTLILDQSGDILATMPPSHQMTWSPKSRYFFSTSRGRFAVDALWRYDVATNEVAQVYAAYGEHWGTYVLKPVVSPDDSLLVLYHHADLVISTWERMNIDGTGVTSFESRCRCGPMESLEAHWLSPSSIVTVNEEGVVSMNPFTGGISTLLSVSDAKGYALSTNQRNFALVTGGEVTRAVSFGSVDPWSLGEPIRLASASSLSLGMYCSSVLLDTDFLFTGGWSVQLITPEGNKFSVIVTQPPDELIGAVSINHFFD